MEHRGNSQSAFFFNRPRINKLFAEAMKYPLIMVYAGSGYGKTVAVHDFVQEYKATTVWIQLSERDNIGPRFWENYIHTMRTLNESLTEGMKKLGFPDTMEKINKYQSLVREHTQKKRRIIVMDDFHIIDNQYVLRFVGEAFRNMPPGTTVIMISRSTVHVNFTDMISSDRIFNISEEDMRFTESEIAQYFRSMNIKLQPNSVRNIMQDTEGWAFAVNLIARSYQKAPGYEGYLRSAMKSNIFRLMETEIWEKISERLQSFLARLSLVGHLSVDLIKLFAGGDKELIAELEKQNAYIRRDNYINAYLIHPLFLEFLAAKQELLTEEQKRETYTIASEWCDKNGFKIDAMSYYEKIGDYKSIVQMFLELPAQIPYDIACYAEEILKRTPREIFDTVEFLASIYMRSLMCQSRWKEAVKLAEYYEAVYSKLPKNDCFRICTLGSVYYCWAVARRAMGLAEDKYDFDLYFEKFDKCLPAPVSPGKLITSYAGPWICNVGVSREGAFEEFTEALKRSVAFISHSFNGLKTGEDDLALGEINFYRGDISKADLFLTRAFDHSHENRQFEIEHRALFYTLRTAVSLGNYQKAEQALNGLKAQLDQTDYPNRFINYDISLCWYYCTLGLCEKAPDWLKENFSPHAHAGFMENFANQIKARYFYQTRNYSPLLSYIQDIKQCYFYLFGRIELLAMEACIYYKMKDKKKAYSALEEAYKTSEQNGITMPFIELGKDMRTLTASALKEAKIGIPKTWLETVNRKSASYAKRLASVITGYKQANNIARGIVISPRENEILTDLSHGFSRSEIAANRSLSINTVKMVISNVYMKLGAENLADAIRIAAERKIV